jgi:hypothetical protein
LADAGLSSVGSDNFPDRLVGKNNLFGFQSVFHRLPWDEKTFGDGQLIILDVAGQFQNFHAIAQRAGDCIEDVCRRYEHYLAQIERHGEIVILKCVVLRWIQDFQQCGRRIAMKAGAELVDFVQHEDGISAAGLSDALNDIARKRTDVGAAMTADIRLVMHPAETLAHEFAIHRSRDALSEGRLADSRRADQAQDRTLSFRHELTHSEKFDDAFFHLLEAVVIRIENFTGLRQIDLFSGQNAPWQFDQPVEVSAQG